MATTFDMNKIILTVSGTSQPALQLYKKLNYVPDKTSPTANKADHIIASSDIRYLEIDF